MSQDTNATNQKLREALQSILAARDDDEEYEAIMKAQVLLASQPVAAPGTMPKWIVWDEVAPEIYPDPAVGNISNRIGVAATLQDAGAIVAAHNSALAQQAEAAPAPTAEPCDYFMPKGRLCPKCGQVHGGQTSAPPAAHSANTGDAIVALQWLLASTKNLIARKPVRDLDEVFSYCERVLAIPSPVGGSAPTMSQFATRADYEAEISGEPVGGHSHGGDIAECFGGCAPVVDGGIADLTNEHADDLWRDAVEHGGDTTQDIVRYFYRVASRPAALAAPTEPKNQGDQK